VGAQETLQSGFQPAITSINTELQNSEANASEINQVANTMIQGQQQLEQTKIAEYNATKPVWELSPVPNENGEYYYYNANTPAGQPTQTYKAGVIPPGVGGSAGGSPQSSPTGLTLSQSNNPYGIKMVSGSENMFTSLGATPGPAAVDGGNFWAFPDAASGEKAARTLLTSATYANDSVDQALRHWSNYTGTGQYPGYNGSILQGTGIDTNATIKSLTSQQIDVVLAKMKQAENVGGQAGTTTSPVGGQFSPQASQKVSALPAAMQSYVDAGPAGVAYVNQDRINNLSQGMQMQIQTNAEKNGIPVVQAADVGALKSIQAVLSNLDNMSNLANKNLNSGVIGHATDTILGGISQWVQTPWGNQLGLFDNYRDTAIKAVQALAGGAGSGLRINGAEIAANTQNLPSASDSKENALLQVIQLKQLIYTQLATTFPYAPVKVIGPTGQTGTIPAGNLAAAIKAGYQIQ
jgi:hypothetical protein